MDMKSICLLTRSSCPSRVRLCLPGEDPSEVYRRWIAPVLTMALLSLPFWAAVVYFSVRRDERNLRKEGEREGKGEEEKEEKEEANKEAEERGITLCRLYFLPETVLFADNEEVKSEAS